MPEYPATSLSLIADVRASNVDKKINPGEHNVRLCNYMDVYSNEYITENIQFMEATATSAEIERFKVECGDVLITKDSETPDDIGIPTIVVDEISNLVCGYHLALIKPDKSRIDPVYLAKQLASSATVKRFSRLANGSTRYGLAYNSITETPIPLPPIPLQNRIAEILSTVDEAIEQTEVLIAKTQRIKAGLMHDLFARGVAPDGQLRPLREEAPQLYKESPLGWIPKEWSYEDVAVVAESLIDGPFGSNLKSEHYVDGEGVRVVRLQNILEGEYNARDRALISQEHARFLIRHTVVTGDILIAALGDESHPVGRSCCYPAGIPGAVNKADCFRLRCIPSLALNYFIMNFMNTSRARNQIRRYEQGVTRRRINLGNLKKVLLVLPGIDEQLLVVQKLQACTNEVLSYTTILEKYFRLKQGLMNDLLSGRVEVPLIDARVQEPAG